MPLPRPDGIHPGALKKLKDEITELLTRACSLSLHQYTRNTTNVMSIFNKQFQGYRRPLCLVFIVGKVVATAIKRNPTKLIDF